MKHRVISTVSLWLGVILILFLFRVPGGVVLLTALSLLTHWEIHQLLQRKGYRPCVRLGMGMGVLFFLLPFLDPIHPAIATHLVLVASGVVFMITTLRTGDPDLIEKSFIPSMVALILGPYLLHFLVLPAASHGLAGLLFSIWLIATAKFTDVCALLVGLRCGKTPFSRLSPKKTWEGVLGGLVGGVLVGWGLHAVLSTHLPVGFSSLNALLVAIPVVILAVAGDLLESAFKRAVGAKDSGRMIPGIGGAFDLTDSLLWSAPVGYLLVFGWLLG